jgi:hypothetical protein
MVASRRPTATYTWAGRIRLKLCEPIPVKSRVDKKFRNKKFGNNKLIWSFAKLLYYFSQNFAKILQTNIVKLGVKIAQNFAKCANLVT